MNNYNFEKYIYKKNNDYYLEFNLPINFKSFIYKIYGNEGYFNFGKFTSYKNNGNNTFIISINSPQLIFIVLSLNKGESEYFDFINMKNELEKNLSHIKRNIKINIKRKENIEKEDIILLVQNSKAFDKESDSDKESDKESDADSDKESDKESDADSDKESDADSNKESDKQSDADSDKESDADSDKESDKQSDADSDKESDKQSDADSDKESDKTKLLKY